MLLVKWGSWGTPGIIISGGPHGGRDMVEIFIGVELNACISKAPFPLV